MSDHDVSEQDLDEAMALAARVRASLGRSEPALRALAVAIKVLRATEPSVADLLQAHDLLYEKLRYRNGGSLERLAGALLEQGHVPAPGDYAGDWWLWWPKKGRGPCRDCGRQRALTRYSARWGKQYRYLCSHCRKAETEADSVLAAEGWSRLQELVDAAPRQRSTTWDDHVERLVPLLGPLETTGWELPESFHLDGEPDREPMIFGELWRGLSVLVFEYLPAEGEVRLLPWENVTGDHPEPIPAVAEEISIDVGEDGEAAVERRAGEAGLLDAFHVALADGVPEKVAVQFEAERLIDLFAPAAEYRELPVAQVAAEAYADDRLRPFLEMTLGFTGRRVQPDVVPSAVALGIAAWCWRNTKGVEGHHLETDVLMARVNIAVTKTVMEYVDPYEGVDWEGVERALTDPGWSLPNGRTVSWLFGEGWPDVVRDVREQVALWRRVEADLLGPDTVLRLLSVAGSTGYTSSWWGQGRWRAICERVVGDAVAGGVPLPEPYDCRGADALVDSLANAPDLESSAVLEWFIDMPEAGPEGPRGLRFHEATSPIVRIHEPWWEED